MKYIVLFCFVLVTLALRHTHQSQYDIGYDAGYEAALEEAMRNEIDSTTLSQDQIQNEIGYSE